MLFAALGASGPGGEEEGAPLLSLLSDVGWVRSMPVRRTPLHLSRLQYGDWKGAQMKIGMRDVVKRFGSWKSLSVVGFCHCWRMLGRPKVDVLSRDLRDTLGDLGISKSAAYSYLKQLRQKLEKDAAAPRYLITEPGVGYRFNPAGQPAEKAGV